MNDFFLKFKNKTTSKQTNKQTKMAHWFCLMVNTSFVSNDYRDRPSSSSHRCSHYQTRRPCLPSDLHWRDWWQDRVDNDQNQRSFKPFFFLTPPPALNSSSCRPNQLLNILNCLLICFPNNFTVGSVPRWSRYLGSIYYPEERKKEREVRFPKHINPFTAPACKSSGLKDARTRQQTVYFPAL